VAIKYNKYQKDLKETNKNRYKDIEENPHPDRNGPVPFATWTPIRALIGMMVPCRPLFSRSGNLLPDPHQGLQACRSQRAKVRLGDGASNSKVY
jgi:hypothetical protein